jgi:hypothetical protein
MISAQKNICAGARVIVFKDMQISPYVLVVASSVVTKTS